MKPACENYHIKSQCKMLLSSIEAFETGIRYAAQKDDGKIDRNEEKIIKDLTKSIEKLKKTLNQYV